MKDKCKWYLRMHSINNSQKSALSLPYANTFTVILSTLSPQCLSEDYSQRHSESFRSFLRQIVAFALASTFLFESLHCKKIYRFSRPQPGSHSSNTPWPGIIKLIPARESLVCYIPAGGGKNYTIFLQCSIKFATFSITYLTQPEKFLRKHLSLYIRDFVQKYIVLKPWGGH